MLYCAYAIDVITVEVVHHSLKFITFYRNFAVKLEAEGFFFDIAIKIYNFSVNLCSKKTILN